MLSRAYERGLSGTGPILAGFVCAAWLFGSCVSASDVVPGSFYLEATITVIDDRDGAPYAETRTNVRWWSESVERWRWELDRGAVDTFGEVSAFSVSDGESVWFYDSADNSFQRTVPFELPGEFTAMPFPSAVLFGPANAPTLDDVAAEFKLRDPEIEIVVAGVEEVLGVQAALVDYRPTWRSVSATASLDGSGAQNNQPGEEESGGVGRMWVDLDTMFILRHEIDGQSNRQYALVEVTHLEHDVAFEDDRFEFVVPDGATEEAPSSDGSSSGSATAP